jgi:hypothetical protein
MPPRIDRTAKEVVPPDMRQLLAVVDGVPRGRRDLLDRCDPRLTLSDSCVAIRNLVSLGFVSRLGLIKSRYRLARSFEANEEREVLPDAMSSSPVEPVACGDSDIVAPPPEQQQSLSAGDLVVNLLDEMLASPTCDKSSYSEGSGLSSSEKPPAVEDSKPVRQLDLWNSTVRTGEIGAVPGRLLEPTRQHLVSWLESHHFEVIDMIDTGGALWVPGGSELKSVLASLLKQGARFHFARRGGRASGGRAAWWWHPDR